MSSPGQLCCLHQALQALAPCRVLLTPDFSIYRDWPPVANQWNVYRSRWCGRLWQEAGFEVISSLGPETGGARYSFLDRLGRHWTVVTQELENLDEPVHPHHSLPHPLTLCFLR
jgi:hypothetical protein